MRLGALLVSALFLLQGCGQNGADNAATGAAEQMAVPAAAADAAGAAAGTDAVVLPRLAYSYRLGYRLPGEAVSPTMAAHLKACADLGLNRCRLISEQLSGGKGDYLTGVLSFEVVAPHARAFADGLDASAARAGGETAERRIESEDLARPMIDAEARITAKQALADRLLELLKRRDGKVGELVEVERAFATAQEEVEAARASLDDMRRRVAMSRISVTYVSSAPVGSAASQPIADAFGAAGRLLGESFGGLIRLVVLLLPWALLILAILLVVRFVRRRSREDAD